jgi:hypothetical protein
MSNNSIIEHRGNYHFVPLREEFLLICLNCKYRKPDTAKSKNKASPYCKAFILAILEGWTNDKRGEGSLAVYMTHRQWSDSMYGMFGRNVIIDSLDELREEKLIAREPYKMYGKDTFQYFLNYRELNRRIRALPERAPDQKFPQQLVYDPFTQPEEDETTRLQVNATDLLINGSSLQVNATRLLVNDDPFTSNHNIDTTKISNIESAKKERETAHPTLPTVPQRDSLSLPPEKSSSLHSKLTDQEADFWTRWCAIAKSPELNETAYPHVVALAAEITSTADLQSLYDFEYDRLRELTKAQGKGEPLPPRLGNLVKALPEWKQTQVRRKQEKEQDQEAHEHIPGSGSITNWTQTRLAGNQPVINYEPLPPVSKIPKDLKRVGDVTKAYSLGLQERIRLAREKRRAEVTL